MSIGASAIGHGGSGSMGKFRARLQSLGIRLLAGLYIALHSAIAPAAWQVHRVLDGDTLVLRDSHGARVSVRIEGIDAPEKGQPYADRSRQSLQLLVQNCHPELLAHKTDRFGRTVGELLCAGRDVGLAQIEAGMAWHFVRYAKGQSAQVRQRYSHAEADARREHRGLWRDAQPTAPWLHRTRIRPQGG